VEILKQAWTQDEINYAGEVYDFKGLTTDPAKPYQTGGPLLYFGGYSPDALELCGQHCDVYLMWPEPKDQIAERMKAVNAVAEKYDRTLDYGLRVHVIVRDTEAEAREYAEHLVSKLDDELRHADPRPRARFGLARRQPPGPRAGTGGPVRLCRAASVDRVGRARSGCGAALVGSADQVLSEIEEYRKMGIRAFIFSGYPHMDECKSIRRLVMPQLKTCSLPVAYGRVPAQVPATPLGAGERR
jgi:alkanesulfonate monooxygenase